MERSADGLGEMLQSLGIQQPELEDAGLEDCALPPHSIMEAFSRAATALSSRVIRDGPHGGDCVQDPGPTNGEAPDALLDDGIKAPSCGGGGNVAAGGGAGGGDRVVVVGDEAAADRVLVLGGDERASCPGDGDDVIRGEKKGDLDVDEGEGDCGDDERPILVEALI